MGVKRMLINVLVLYVMGCEQGVKIKEEGSYISQEDFREDMYIAVGREMVDILQERDDAFFYPSGQDEHSLMAKQSKKEKGDRGIDRDVLKVFNDTLICYQCCVVDSLELVYFVYPNHRLEFASQLHPERIKRGFWLPATDGGVVFYIVSEEGNDWGGCYFWTIRQCGEWERIEQQGDALLFIRRNRLYWDNNVELFTEKGLRDSFFTWYKEIMSYSFPADVVDGIQESLVTSLDSVLYPIEKRAAQRFLYDEYDTLRCFRFRYLP